MKPEELGTYYESILDKEARKEGGVYYTPPLIVEYMVKNSLGDVLKGKTPAEVAKIRIVDPACGAGVFLTAVYQYLLDWHVKHIGKLTQTQRRKILNDNIFGVDIDPQAVEITKYCLLMKCFDGKDFSLNLTDNICCGNSLIDSEFCWNKKFPHVFKQGGFDIVIGNPPYLKEGRISKAVFLPYKNSPYYQGKMDLWYMFACCGIDMLKNNGHLCFIATSNWVTSSGASKLRNKVVSDTQIKQLVDFGNFMIFESASIQTMIMLFSKDNRTNNYKFDYRKISGDTTLADALDLLSKRTNNKATYLFPKINRNELKDNFFTFSSNDVVLDKIAGKKVYLTEKEVAQGVVFPQDFLSKKNQKILERMYLVENEVANGIHPHYDFVNKKIATLHNFKIGEGIFGLSMKEKEGLHLSENELDLLKPYYTTEQIQKYYSNPENKLWLIYTDSSFKNPNSMKDCPNLKTHLDRFANVITSDNKPYGLHRARKERFFKGKKIIVQRKCTGHPSFSYSEFDCYVSATFYVIKTNRLDLKYLVGLLNSKLIAFWLKNKGKMQGENYQVDKEPLLQIPIFDTTKEQAKPIITLVKKILSAKAANPQADTNDLERKVDKLVYELYGLTKDEIAIVEGAL